MLTQAQTSGGIEDLYKSIVMYKEKNMNSSEILLKKESNKDAEFKMILQDEISRYKMPHDFGPVVSFAGKVLTGIDPTELSPAYSLSKQQNYFLFGFFCKSI